ncbi:YaiO family outer membrane beta-barrel protein [Sphingomonas sp. DG1-23]|uniref:YaiO family outer membrane beta-barrel protein n=1 Tax=Sphingomonas sp. DG1-23 TaxID=3068316 RepID=UPI00273F53D5|nr:YaiO family outer membrane beta-barrel protein [Sphingomonas sp. DG1-23]MDP5277944.1 YaiO family outer membrane beta-barrel protein [Sphingomonas sp. DG1-23]
MFRRTAEGAALLALLASSATAFAQIGADRETTISEARAAIARGDKAAAIARLEAASIAWPNDPEVLRLLGSAYAYAQRYREAIATLRAAQVLAPEDLDIRAALARAHLWSGDRDAARRELAAIEARDPGNADLAAIRNQLALPQGERATTRRGVFASQSVARVTPDNRPDRTWWTTTLGAFGPIARGTTLSVEAEREDRGVAVDTHLLARVDHQFSPGWRGYLTAAATPEADFREQWSIRGGIEADMSRRVTLLADVRHADYGQTQVTAVEPGIRFGVPALRSSATLRMINLWDERGEHRSGWSARVDTGTRSGAGLFAGVASYPDTEAGITRRVRSVFAGAAIPVSADVTIRATGEYERRVDTYTRKGLSVGLQLRL